MTDDECIATALLHGAKIWPENNSAIEAYAAKYGVRRSKVFAIDRGFHEHMSCMYEDGSKAFDEADSIAGACRAYCERHNLMR